MATNSAPLSATDPHSYANSDLVRTTHIDINLRCDFQRKILFGFVTLAVELVQNATELLLDANALAIEKVVDLETGNALLWTVPAHHKSFGYCIRVPLPTNKQVKGSTAKIQIRYSTTPESAGIQWFEPQQTEGKKHPYVYTQLESISARTFVPCQDSPSVKAPYTIKVTVPSPLVVACSGLPVREDPLFEEDGWLTYEYEQKVPIPAYLIALAAGALKKAAIGPRSSVWTEKELLDACVHEYSEVTEKFLQAAEKNFGVPYQWGKYDILVLPSAFPYAGMENPNLTFLSKSLLAGDRSLCNVLAHEISHSWCGNLVTNASWNNFWINEWFTVYSERLLLGELYGEEYRHFEALIGYNDLIKTVNDFGATHGYTKLVPDLNGIHPDDVFSKIPLEKGFLFTFYLETLLGKDPVLRFANYYFNTFKYKNVDAPLVKEHILKYFSETEHVSEEVLNQIDWNDWFYTPGLPKFDPRTVLSKSVAEVCLELAEKWIERDGEGTSSDDLKSFRATQTMYFLDQLLTRAVPMKHQVLRKLGDLYQLSASTNVEIQFRWIVLSLKSKDASIIPVAADFLSKHGRGLYVLPMYRALNDLDHARAVQIYHANRSFYHNILTTRLDVSLAK